jgi:hypothetical protein
MKKIGMVPAVFMTVSLLYSDPCVVFPPVTIEQVRAAFDQALKDGYSGTALQIIQKVKKDMPSLLGEFKKRFMAQFKEDPSSGLAAQVVDLQKENSMLQEVNAKLMMERDALKLEKDRLEKAKSVLDTRLGNMQKEYETFRRQLSKKTD